MTMTKDIEKNFFDMECVVHTGCRDGDVWFVNKLEVVTMGW